MIFVIRKRYIVSSVLALSIFMILSDMFRQKDFKDDLQNKFSSFLDIKNKTTTHSLFNWLDTASDRLAGIISFTVVTILGSAAVISFFLRTFYLNII